MFVPTDQSHLERLSVLLLFCALLVSQGCAHKIETESEKGIWSQFVDQSTQAALVYEKKGKIANAVEELKIALTIDPENLKAREELHRLMGKCDLEAQKHFKSGMALRDYNRREAQKQFLEVLRIRPDYQQAITGLRDLQLMSSEVSIQARLKKEAGKEANRKIQGSITGHKTKAEEPTDEEEADTEDYSLNIAISAYENGDYVTAIREFEKMKALYPRDPDIKAYLNRSWYNHGIDLFNKRDYRNALHSFSKLPKGYGSVNEYIAKCKQALNMPLKK